MPRPLPPEPLHSHMSRWPESLHAAVVRIAAREDMSVASLERMWVESMVVLYDAGDEVASLDGV